MKNFRSWLEPRTKLGQSGIDEVILQQLARRRWGRVFKYATLSLAGVYGLIYPSILISEKIGSLTVYVFSAFLVVGGAVCCIGSLSDRWIAEYAALPALITSVFVFGAAVILASSNAPSAMTYGLVILAFSFGLSARFRDVQAVMRISKLEVDRQRHERG